jgi:hypothetical protein
VNVDEAARITNEYEPPAKYAAEDADELVAHPRNEYPLLLGRVDGSVTE